MRYEIVAAFIDRLHRAEPDANSAGGAARAACIPSSLVRLSISALTATMMELPDIDSAAISGLNVNG
jgi:hypothetical protein